MSNVKINTRGVIVKLPDGSLALELGLGAVELGGKVFQFSDTITVVPLPLHVSELDVAGVTDWLDALVRSSDLALSRGAWRMLMLGWTLGQAAPDADMPSAPEMVSGGFTGVEPWERDDA